MYDMKENESCDLSFYDHSNQSEASFSQASSSMCSTTSSYQGAGEMSMYPDVLNQAFTEATGLDYDTDTSYLDMSGQYSNVSYSSYSDMSLNDSGSMSYSQAGGQSGLPVGGSGQCNFSFPSGMQSSSRASCHHGNSSATCTKPKRKRVINKVQRKAANVRERKRMVTLNDAFERLKERVPHGPKDKRMSRIDTLKTAISYITNMQTMLMMSDRQMAAAMQQHPGHSGYHGNHSAAPSQQQHIAHNNGHLL